MKKKTLDRTENNPAKKRKDGFLLIVILFAFLYFTSYMTRKSFSAIKLGLPEGYLLETQIGYIGSALFFAYGLGQIISGVLGDRIDPRKLILCGLGMTASCNLLFPFIHSVPVLIALWAVNGFAQALFWPPIVKLLTIYLQGDRYTKAVMYVSMGSHGALVAIYALATLIIRFDAWKPIFYIVSALAVILGAGLIFGFRALERRRPGLVREAMLKKAAPAPQEQPDAAKKGKLLPVILASGLLFVFFMMVMNGFLRDGIEEWMSTYIKDIFALEADTSTLMNIFMPLFGLLCVRITTFLYLKIFRDEIKEALVLSGVIFTSTLLLGIFWKTNLWLSVGLIVLAVGSIHALNTVITCYLPARFVKSGKVSTVSGLVNAFVYVGSTAATSLIPLIFQHFDWRVAIFCWAAAGFLCVACCLLIRRRWNRFISES